MNLMEWFFWKPEGIFAISCFFFLGYLVICLFRHKLSSMGSWLVIAWALLAVWVWVFTIQKNHVGKAINPMKWFFWKPERAFAVSCFFFLGYLVIRLFSHKLSFMRRRPLLIPAVVWLLYAVWEWVCTVNRGYIRVDLFLIYPILIVVSIYGLSVSIRSLI